MEAVFNPKPDVSNATLTQYLSGGRKWISVSGKKFNGADDGVRAADKYVGLRRGGGAIVVGWAIGDAIMRR